MKETLKEFVLFGNFNEVDYTKAIELLNQLSQFKFKLTGFNEFISIAQPLPPVQPAQQANNMQLANNLIQNAMLTPQPRPALISEDGKLKLTFGVSRINMDSSMDSVKDVSAFVNLIKFVSTYILSIENTSVNRIALNGQFLIERSEKDISYLDKLYKKTKIYDYDDELTFRINSRKKSDALGCNVNRITTINKTYFNVAMQKQPIMLMYDYNTEIDLNRSFSINDISSFIEESIEFRKLFIEEYSK